MIPKRICAGLLCSALMLLFLPSSANAQTIVGNCFFQNGPSGANNVIIMPGSTSLIPVVQFLGAKLVKMSNPYLLVYFPMASCDAMGRVNGTQYLSGTGQYYKENPTDPTKIDTFSCTIDGSVPIDLAVGDTFYETCDASYARAPSLGDFQGPEQAFVFITPRNSLNASTITAAEAQVVFGCGPRGQVAPYLDDNFIFTYKNGQDVRFGAQLIVGKAINLGYFQDNGSSVSHSHTSDQDEAAAVASSTSSPPDETIGFISAEVYDQLRDQLKALAFRDFRQTLAYLPDSNSNSRDKRNLRDGHYTIQAPMHMWVSLNTDGSFVRPLARKMVDWMQGNQVAPADQLPFSINDVYAQAGVVPKCAMKVMRTVDGGPFAPFVSEKPPCGCVFESTATGVAVPPGCIKCTDNSGCNKGQMCSYGFCELAW